MLPYRRVQHCDDFQTPPHALAPLLPYLPRAARIWEPACGQGNLVKALRKAGFRVRGTDIKTGTNFLDYRPVPEGCEDFFGKRSRKPLGDVVLTNPPYKLADEFLAIVYELDLPFALLLPVHYLQVQARQCCFRTFGVEVLVLHKHVHYERPDKKKSKCGFGSAWFCRKLLPEPLMFEKP